MRNEGKLSWWIKNRDALQSEYHVLKTNDNFTVTIMNFVGYEELPKGTRDGSIDDYTCFDNTNDEHKKCIYNDIAIVVRGNINGKTFINIDNKTYILTPNGIIALE